MSLSARRAWIEIRKGSTSATMASLSLSARRAWIEIMKMWCSGAVKRSLSARRAWIEILGRERPSKILPSLSARRAWIEMQEWQETPSVEQVALRKESVDRNIRLAVGISPQNKSLSARRAWIEITLVQIIISGYASRSPQGERG